MLKMMSKGIWPGWETVRVIGRGSFGTVYEIRRESLEGQERAAVKVIPVPQHEEDIEEMMSDGYDQKSIAETIQSYVKSITSEYSLMNQLKGNPNIVNCDSVRYEQHEDGLGCDIVIKMELLSPLIKVLPESISEKQTIAVGKDIARALTHCHEYHIIHRDIKPQNILRSSAGNYKLGDFGIAKTVERTSGGTKIGTYKYMAPEVYNNQPYGEGADIYSLGLVLYWMLNERRMPFLPLPPEKLSPQMEEHARLRRFNGEELPEPVHGSKELKAIVMKACSFDPADRFADAKEMLESLERLESQGEEDFQIPINDYNSSDDITVSSYNPSNGMNQNSRSTLPDDGEDTLGYAFDYSKHEEENNIAEDSSSQSHEESRDSGLDDDKTAGFSYLTRYSGNERDKRESGSLYGIIGKQVPAGSGLSNNETAEHQSSENSDRNATIEEKYYQEEETVGVWKQFGTEKTGSVDSSDSGADYLTTDETISVSHKPEKKILAQTKTEREPVVEVFGQRQEGKQILRSETEECEKADEPEDTLLSGLVNKIKTEPLLRVIAIGILIGIVIFCLICVTTCKSRSTGQNTENKTSSYPQNQYQTNTEVKGYQTEQDSQKTTSTQATPTQKVNKKLEGTIQSNLEGNFKTRAFKLAETVNNCKKLTMSLTFIDRKKELAGDWNLYAKGLDGYWNRIGTFVINESVATNGTEYKKSFTFIDPISFSALIIAKSKTNERIEFRYSISFE